MALPQGDNLSTGLVVPEGSGVAPLVSREVLFHTLDRTRQFLDVWERSRRIGGFAISAADQLELDGLKYAGDDLAWALMIDPGHQGGQFIISRSEEADTSVAIDITQPTTTFDTHMTLFEDGTLGMWTPNGDGGDSNLMYVDTSGADRDEMSRTVYMVPLNDTGFPRALRPTPVIYSGGSLRTQDPVSTEDYHNPSAYL